MPYKKFQMHTHYKIRLRYFFMTLENLLHNYVFICLSELLHIVFFVQQFCCGLCFLFGGLILVGNALSGLLLAYLVLMAVLIGPGIVLHIVPPQMKQNVVQYWTCFHSAFIANGKYALHFGIHRFIDNCS